MGTQIEFGLSKEQKEEMKQKLQDYFLKERGEDLGDLPATLMYFAIRKNIL